MELNSINMKKILTSFIIGLIFSILSFGVLNIIGGYTVEANLYINDK